MSVSAKKRLLKEYDRFLKSPTEGILAQPVSEGNLLEWEAVIEGPRDSAYDCGVFCARLSFPSDYPLSPPSMRFTTPMFHPNIYPDGRVCISILHSGSDATNYERDSERWSAVQTIDKVLLSVMSMLAEPNTESPANVDAAVMYRDHRAEFLRRVDETIRMSLGLR